MTIDVTTINGLVHVVIYCSMVLAFGLGYIGGFLSGRG